MSEEFQHPEESAQAFPPEEELEDVPLAEDRLDMEDLYPVRLELTADLGKCTLMVARCARTQTRLGLAYGTNSLGKWRISTSTGFPWPRGEIVVLGDSLHVRIAEIFGLGEKDAWLYD